MTCMIDHYFELCLHVSVCAPVLSMHVHAYRLSVCVHVCTICILLT